MTDPDSITVQLVSVSKSLTGWIFDSFSQSLSACRLQLGEHIVEK